MKRFSGRERWVSEVLACRSVRGNVTQGIFKVALSKCNFLRSLEKKWLTGKVFFNGIMKCLMANQWKIEMIFPLKNNYFVRKLPDVTCQTEPDDIAFGVKRNPCSRNVGPKSCMQPRTWHMHCVRAESRSNYQLINQSFQRNFLTSLTVNLTIYIQVCLGEGP